MAPINLTGSQVRAIQKWGAATPQVLEVRLFGSRAKGLARPDSDVDLAVTVGGSKGATVPGNYGRFGECMGGPSSPSHRIRCSDKAVQLNGQRSSETLVR